MARMRFTELTEEGKAGLRDRFPEVFRERDTKHTFSYGQTPFTPSENPETGAWTVEIRRCTERYNWRRAEDRFRYTKQMKVRIPEEWVKVTWGDDRYRGPLNDVLGFRG